MENFQGRPLDDANVVHDFLLFGPGKLLTVQVVKQDPVIQPYRPSRPYTPLRVVPGKQVECRHKLLPKLDRGPLEVAGLQTGFC